MCGPDLYGNAVAQSEVTVHLLDLSMNLLEVHGEDLLVYGLEGGREVRREGRRRREGREEVERRKEGGRGRLKGKKERGGRQGG